MKHKKIAAMIISTLMAVTAIGGCNNEPTHEGPTGTLASTTETKETTEVVETEAPVETTAASVEEIEEEELPEPTEVQEKIIDAIDVVVDTTPISREMLVEALIEKGFEEADIEYALKFTDVNFKDMAITQAIDFILDSNWLSRQMIADMLAKLKYTKEDIEAVINCEEIDWNNQAYYAAIELMYDDMEIDELKKLMVENYLFSEEEVDYAINEMQNPSFNFNLEGDVEFGEVIPSQD